MFKLLENDFFWNENQKEVEFPDLSPIAKKCFNELYQKMKSEREKAKKITLAEKRQKRTPGTKKFDDGLRCCYSCSKIFHIEKTILTKAKKNSKQKQRFCFDCYEKGRGVRIEN